MSLLKGFLTGLTSLWSVNLLAVTPFKYMSMTNQKCKVRPEIVDVNSDEPAFYLLILKQINALIVVTISRIYMQK